MRLLSCRLSAAPLTACLVLALSLLSPAARADDVEQFYKGKTIRVIGGHSVGGGYDLYARLLARHWSKRIPGQPSIVVQTMTGAGGLRLMISAHPFGA